jgi:microsomal dipeptidase-like Zn-dependent dipeptidase
MLKLKIKLVIVAVAILLMVALCLFFFVAPSMVEKSLNQTLQLPPYNASEKANTLHKKLIIADFHADPLLWGRDLLERGTRGHIDVPRLVEGNVALQVFSVVTKTPRGLNIERNDDKTDNVFPLIIAQRLPFRTWNSLKERALYQASQLNYFASESNRKLVLVQTKTDLSKFLERRKQEPDIVSGLLAIEGAHALDGDCDNVDVLFNAGFRMMSPSHFFDTEMGGSAHGINKSGLTENGKEMIRRMEAKRMVIDIAHASPQTIDDILKIATRPVVVSHTGVKGTCNNTRNLSDEQLKAIAAKGGIIGIGYWDTAVCGTDAKAIAKAIRYTANLIGVDHVALGSDFDGAVIVPFDTSGLVLLTDALMQEGFSDEEIAKIMGGNEIKFLQENLPD